jgi:bacterioferritin-associated ferredoxin
VIVCHCNAISDRAIRAAVRDGARSCGEVARACNAGHQCGGCRPAIRELIACETTDASPVCVAAGLATPA